MQTKNLKKIYPKTTLTFENLDFQKGVLCIDGPSGTGKTTLMKILAGLDTKFEGTVNGLFPTSEVGYFFHDYKLISSLSIVENILFANAHKLWKTSEQEKKEEIKKLAEKLQIADQLSTPVESLSAGQYQRVCLLRAFVGEKQFILLDEPISHLDAQTAQKVCELILEKLASGVLFCVATHNKLMHDFFANHDIPLLFIDTTYAGS